MSVTHPTFGAQKFKTDVETNKQPVEVNPAMSAAHRLINAFNEDALKRYQELQKEKKEKNHAQDNEKSKTKEDAKDKTKKGTQSKAAEKDSLRSQHLNDEALLKEFPKLKKYLEDIKNLKAADELFCYCQQRLDCGLLEKALSYAIEIQDQDFINELLTLPLPDSLKVDLDCIVLITGESLSIPPRLVQLVCFALNNINNFGLATTAWTPAQISERIQIIHKLLMAGASINLLYPNNSPSFLQLLTRRAFEYPEFKEILLFFLHRARALDLDLNIVDGHELTLLMFLVQMVQSRFPNIKVEVDKIGILKDIIQAIVRNSKQNYSLMMVGFYTIRLLDMLIDFIIKSQNDIDPKAFSEISSSFEIIFEDMAQQSLDHVQSLKHLPYRNIPEELEDYVGKHYAYNKTYSHEYVRNDYGRRSIYDGTVYDKIIKRALQTLKEQYRLGFSFQNFQRLIEPHSPPLRDSLWPLIFAYCYENLSCLYEANRLSVHFRLPNSQFRNLTFDEVLPYVNSIQIVPLGFNYVTLSLIEADPAFNLKMTQKELLTKSTDAYIFRPWVPSAAERTLLVTGTKVATIAAESASGTAYSSHSSAARKEAVSSNSNSSFSPSSNSTKTSVVLMDSKKLKLDAQTSGIHTNNPLIKFYEYWLVIDDIGGDILRCQFMVQSSLQQDATITTIQYYINSRPRSAFLYLTKGPSLNAAYQLDLAWKQKHLPGGLAGPNLANALDCSETEDHIYSKTFEKLAEDLKEAKEASDKVAAASSTSTATQKHASDHVSTAPTAGNRPLLLSSSAQQATSERVVTTGSSSSSSVPQRSRATSL